MEKKIEELKQDIAELQGFETQSQRQKVRDVLSLEIRKLSTELIRLQEEYNQSGIVPTPSASSESMSTRKYRVKLNIYAWDQTPKFVKFYVTLPKVHTIAPENVSCNFTNKSLELTVQNLENKDYEFAITNLLDDIDPERSNWKIKTDKVLINAAKVKETNWPCVTELEKKAKDAQNSKYKPDDKMDPGEGIMSLMKNMYEQGDDEMKRTIAKAWTESQNKSNVL